MSSAPGVALVFVTRFTLAEFRLEDERAADDDRLAFLEAGQDGHHPARRLAHRHRALGARVLVALDPRAHPPRRPPVSPAVTMTLANMPGRSLSSALRTSTRTLPLRVSGFSAGAMCDTFPSNRCRCRDASCACGS